ncbi:MAG: NTP transferase domain-containing protein [Desulfobacterales bacterium]
MITTDQPATACTGVILAGRLNTRFSGKNKAFIRFGDHRVIDHIYAVFRSVFDEIILVTNQPAAYLGFDLTIVTDIFAARSSLTGIHTGLFYARTPFIFVTACDTPFCAGKWWKWLSPGFMRKMRWCFRKPRKVPASFARHIQKSVCLPWNGK